MINYRSFVAVDLLDSLLSRHFRVSLLDIFRIFDEREKERKKEKERERRNFDDRKSENILTQTLIDY